MTDIQNIPPGIRRNNPGNLRDEKINWVGLAKPENGFCVFTSPVFGIRALSLDLYNSNALHHRDSILAITSHYAPPDENNTIEYANELCGFINIHTQSSFTVSSPINLKNYEIAFAYVRGVIIRECGLNNGNEWYAARDIRLAMELTDKWTT